MATRYNLTGIRGDTRTFVINVPDIDITGYTFRLTVKNIDDVATNDTSAFGLGFVATTGTPTIRIVQVQAYAHNLS